MRKMFVIALREYNAAVRTKAFLIGLLVMPLLMGGSILAQEALKGFRDTKEKRFAVIDRTPGAVLFGTLQDAVLVWNQQATDPSTGALLRPRFALEKPPPSTDGLDALRLELSERVRKGELAGVLEIPPEVVRYPPGGLEESVIRYQSNSPAQQEFTRLAEQALTPRIRALRSKAVGLPPDKIEQIIQPVVIEPKGLSVRDGELVKDANLQNRMASVLVPLLLTLLMFMMVLMTTTPLMQGVVEEKMQRIAEVLLGSVSPFRLMLGKILGMTAVSLTMAAVYLGGACFSAYWFGYAEYAPLGLLGWFVLYQALASLMYGSLFIAIGAACTDMKETQNLLWPVMLLATLPILVLGNVVREPNSGVVTVLSFFPFATPMLMLARQAVPPGVPAWQPPVGIVGVVATTLFCVWAAGRVFRVGILMQGKGANLVEMARWVFRG